jgi:hypothetical protein
MLGPDACMPSRSAQNSGKLGPVFCQATFTEPPTPHFSSRSPPTGLNAISILQANVQLVCHSGATPGRKLIRSPSATGAAADRHKLERFSRRRFCFLWGQVVPRTGVECDGCYRHRWKLKRQLRVKNKDRHNPGVSVTADGLGRSPFFDVKTPAGDSPPPDCLPIGHRASAARAEQRLASFWPTVRITSRHCATRASRGHCIRKLRCWSVVRHLNSNSPRGLRIEARGPGAVRTRLNRRIEGS